MDRERALFQTALGLPAPWQVVEVRLDPEAKELHLCLDFPPSSRFPCPDCGDPAPVYNTDPERVWRHLNFFEHRTLLHARFPRTHCPTCGVKTVEAPWARPGSGFTLLFEAFVLTLAKQMPVATAASLVGEHDTCLWRVEHYVEDARATADWGTVHRIGLDETARGRGHDYVTLFVDQDTHQVLTVTPGKDAGTVNAFAADLAAHHGCPEAVETVTLDFSAGFRKGVVATLPQAQLVFGHFHAPASVSDALDQIRRVEAKRDPRLKGTRYLWLRNPQDLTAVQREKLTGLAATELQTVQAYGWKLELPELWKQPDREAAAVYLERWCDRVLQSELPLLQPLQQAARTLQEHAEGVLNYFPTRLTNGLLEGLR